MLAAGNAHAACLIENAVYRDRDKRATVEFEPTKEAAAVTNTFRMRFGETLALEGIVMWSEDVPRPNGLVMNQCPEGDVTGEELAQCTVWQGVVYASDASGEFGLLPDEGAEAPAKLLFPDLAPALRAAPVLGESIATVLPWDVFLFERCAK